MRIAGLVAIVILLAGCTTTDSMPTYVVRFTLYNTSGGTLEVNDYPHCGTAELHDDHVLVQSPKPRGKAIAYIEPTFAGSGWVYTGNEPMARGLDPLAHVPDGITATFDPVLTLEVRKGDLLIDGVPRDLPFEGTSWHPDGLWNATFTVEKGPHEVRVDHRTYSCA